MFQTASARIADLAVIGDQRSAALVERGGRIVWYCPGRFDEPSLLAELLDPEAGGWSVEAAGLTATGRSYLGDSFVLQTQLSAGGHPITLTDFMPMGPASPAGVICRMISASPLERRFVLRPRPDYARGPVSLRSRAGAVLIDGGHRAHASHPLAIDHEQATIRVVIPPGEAGWMVLASRDLVFPTDAETETWLHASRAVWPDTEPPDADPHQAALRASLRAIRLLTYAETGGVIAAVTTSLPEIIGGTRNYDYRYVWLRDAGLVASALARAGTENEGARFLEFLSSTHGRLSTGAQPLAPLISVAGEVAPTEQILNLAGWQNSRPVRIGNGALAQLQLDAYGNLLFAAQAVFNRTGRIPQWAIIEAAANFLAAHWREAEAGIWEEEAELQHTSSKAIVACGLSWMATHAPDPILAAPWLRAVADIKAYVAANCIRPDGAYAAIAGGHEVDIAAALLPFWGFDDAGSTQMTATMAALDRDYSRDGLLYRRRLETDDSSQEGYFLAGTLWAAKYWIAAGELDRGRAIIDAVLAYANDLGFLAEEVHAQTEELLGNFPQIFVHAALIGAIMDLDEAKKRKALLL